MIVPSIPNVSIDQVSMAKITRSKVAKENIGILAIQIIVQEPLAEVFTPF